MKDSLLKSRVIYNRKLNDKFRLIRFKTENAKFNFKPGQYTILKVSPSIFRAYSVASLPKDLPYWNIICDVSPAGPGIKFLTKLTTNEIIETSVPAGALYWHQNNSNKFVLAATGSGIASIKPISEEILRQNKNNKIYLFWGLRKIKDIFFSDKLSKMKKKYSNFNFEIIISQPESSYQGAVGHINPYLLKTANKLPVTKTSYYLCGGRQMVEDIKRDLFKKGIPENRIYFEKCY